MPERPVEQLTLRQKFIDSDRLTRELIEHLEQGFIPKANSLGKTAKSGLEENPLEPVRDLTVRTRASELLESEKFTDQLYEKMARYFEGIERDCTQIRDGA
jgi:hypothetical protein